MALQFEDAWQKIRSVEGGYSNRMGDRGGETKFGITQSIALAWGYKAEMADLTDTTAQAIAKWAFWDPLRMDNLTAISEPVAMEVFDTGYNMSPRQATLFLQHAINTLQLDAQPATQIVEDGVLGTATLRALDLFKVRRGLNGITVLMRCLNALQCVEYMRQANAIANDRQFIYGWVRMRVVMEASAA